MYKMMCSIVGRATLPPEPQTRLPFIDTMNCLSLLEQDCTTHSDIKQTCVLSQLEENIITLVSDTQTADWVSIICVDLRVGLRWIMVVMFSYWGDMCHHWLCWHNTCDVTLWTRVSCTPGCGTWKMWWTGCNNIVSHLQQHNTLPCTS